MESEHSEKSKLIVALILLALLISIVWGQRLLGQPARTNDQPMTDLQDKEESLAEPEISGWVPWWENERAISSLALAQGKLREVLPVWYRLSSKGQIEPIVTENKETITRQVAEQGMIILPTIGNELDGKRVSFFLENSAWEEEIKKLINWAKEENYQGWDLDWEEIKISDREHFSEFASLLADQLHQEGLKLSVTVHAQTGQADDWEGAMGQDWQALGQVVDQIRIMAYDFHHANSKPGAVTPPEKLKEVLEFALKELPEEKIILGLPTYGYDWASQEGEPLQYEEIIARLEKYQGKWKKDKKLLALKGEYQLNGVKHELWFENSQTMADKINLARSFGINRFCFWSLGGEDSQFWEISLSDHDKTLIGL